MGLMLRRVEATETVGTIQVGLMRHQVSACQVNVTPTRSSVPRQVMQAKQTAQNLGIHAVTLHSWLRQDGIDHSCRPGLNSRETVELRGTRGRVR